MVGADWQRPEAMRCCIGFGNSTRVLCKNINCSVLLNNHSDPLLQGLFVGGVFLLVLLLLLLFLFGCCFVLFFSFWFEIVFHCVRALGETCSVDHAGFQR